MGRTVQDIFTILIAFIPVYLLIRTNYYDTIIAISIFGGFAIIVLANLSTIILDLFKIEKPKLINRIDVSAMVAAYIYLFGVFFGEALAAPAIFNFFDWNAIPFGFYFVFTFTIMLVITNTMSKVDSSTALVLTIPILLVTLFAKLVISAVDVVFPPKVRELIPYIDVTRTLILSISQFLADPDRLETEEVLDSLDNVSGQVEEIAEGYAIRKSIGQGIDIGLTIVVFAFFGVLTLLTDDLGIPTSVVALMFSSLAIAFATFAGLFGPFYGLAGACKDFTLKYGNYRGAAFYKILEQLFSIPFMAASAGYLLFDLPPIDAETLEDFKNEMQEQMTEISDNVSSLLGKDKSAIPRKTRKMIAELTQSAEANLAKLDFRNIREETARQFALIYYQHEYPWKPWARKRAVAEFARKNNFDLETAEDTLKLIGYKIKAGQMTDDMVNNVMISAALKGIIQMEQKYQELFEDVELGQTCTGLAFGARQFLKDHYVVTSTSEKIRRGIKNLFIGVFAIPIVSIIAFHKYANRFFDVLVEQITDGIFLGRSKEVTKLRYYEINSQLKIMPDEILQKLKDLRSPKEDKEEVRRNWQIRRKIRRLFGMIWEVAIFPFMIVYNIGKWFYKQIFPTEKNPREEFEEAISHSALVSMYDELNQRLVMQTHVTSAY